MTPPGGMLRRLPAVVAPLFIAVGQVQGTRFAAEDQPESLPLDTLAFALLLAGPLALIARRRLPMPVLGAVLAVTVTYYVLGYPYGPAFLGLTVALFGAVSRGYRRAAWIGAGAGYAALLGLQALPGGAPAPTLAQAAGIGAWTLVVLMASEGVRIRIERAAEAARIREEQARRQAGEERLQIARELHDVLAHNISLINVQASVALHLLDEQPDAARGALTTIKQASKEVLIEIRSVLGVLRGVDETAPRAPAPGLDRLDDLVARSSAAGLDVRADIRVGTGGAGGTGSADGTASALPAAVDLAAYRIVQESLTNAARHAGTGRATVRVHHDPGTLRIEVDNDMTGTPGVPGHGITGMRERAAALGGELTAGAANGRFQVRAVLPVPEGETS